MPSFAKGTKNEQRDKMMNYSRYVEIKVTYNGAKLSFLAKNRTFPMIAYPLLRPSDRRSMVALLYEGLTARNSSVKTFIHNEDDQLSNSSVN